MDMKKPLPVKRPITRREFMGNVCTTMTSIAVGAGAGAMIGGVGDAIASTHTEKSGHDQATEGSIAVITGALLGGAAAGAVSLATRIYDNVPENTSAEDIARNTYKEPRGR